MNLPSKLYVYIDDDGETIAKDSLQGCAVFDETRIVGVYSLEKTVRLLSAESQVVERAADEMPSKEKNVQ